MKIKYILQSILSIMLLFSFTSCQESNKKSIASNETAYDSPENWLDRNKKNTNSKVDVFYLYPTVWQMANDDDAYICDIDDPLMRDGAQQAYDRQASLFIDIANIYAPFYRQADAGYTLNLDSAGRKAVIGSSPTEDATAAFDYYLTNYNTDRPFILAGHSQGSEVLMNIMKDYMVQKPELFKRLVGAYLIGYSVTPSDLNTSPYLTFTQEADDNHVIISYNTEAPEVDPPGNPVLSDGALVVNPITWTYTTDLIPAEQSKGGYYIEDDGPDGTNILANLPADAQINPERGVVVVSNPDLAAFGVGNDVFGAGVLHKYDYPFFYYDIQNNVKARIKRYTEDKDPNLATF